MKVLLVDDEKEILEYLQDVFGNSGIESKALLSPFEAVALCETEHFDAILTDFKMPRMSGLEMITHIRAGRLNRDTPFIVLSGALDDEILMKLEKLGIIDVMSKPPELDILIRIIEKRGRSGKSHSTRSYNPDLVAQVDLSFFQVMIGHLGKLVEVEENSSATIQAMDVEYSGLVSLFGRRLSGRFTISYERGFSREFAKTLLGRDVLDSELDIFESTTGEIADQVAADLVPALNKNMQLSLFASPPVILKGRWPTPALPANVPHGYVIAKLNGLRCSLEYAFVDLNEHFKNISDSQQVPILI
jgi:CheY-like chemotaxis protein